MRRGRLSGLLCMALMIGCHAARISPAAGFGQPVLVLLSQASNLEPLPDFALYSSGLALVPYASGPTRRAVVHLTPSAIDSLIGDLQLQRLDTVPAYRDLFPNASDMTVYTLIHWTSGGRRNVAWRGSMLPGFRPDVPAVYRSWYDQLLGRSWVGAQPWVPDSFDIVLSSLKWEVCPPPGVTHQWEPSLPPLPEHPDSTLDGGFEWRVASSYLAEVAQYAPKLGRYRCDMWGAYGRMWILRYRYFAPDEELWRDRPRHN